MSRPTPNSTVLELLLELEERQATEPRLTLESLGADRPDLLTEARHHLAVLRSVDSLLAVKVQAAEELLPVLSGYDIVRRLGEGGMGTVYLARDLNLDRMVAVKLPRASFSCQSQTKKPDSVGTETGRRVRERFRREARLLASLRHPHIVSVYSAELVGDRPHLVMEYIAGGSLSDRQGQFLENQDAVGALLERVAAGVHHAHKEGILHRDLKPSNILLDGEGQPKVVDFGVAALLTGEPVRSAAGDTPPDQHPSVRTALTRTGQVAGTIAYSAPELFGANPVVTPAADVWSLGVIAYELLVGQLPYPNGPVGKHAEPPPRPRAMRSEIDPGLERIVLTCLCSDPRLRYASAEQLGTALARWQRRKKRWRIFTRLVAPVLGILLVIGVAVALLWPPSPASRHEARSREARTLLSRGEPVTLVGETGGPVSSRFVLGEGYARSFRAPDGQFHVAAGRPALLELLTDPEIDSFRIHAEIRQDGFLSDAIVGVYFGHRVLRIESGEVHLLAHIRFSDLGPQSEQATKVGGPRMSLAGLDWLCLFPPVATGTDWLWHNGPNREYAPPRPENRAGPWRSMSVEINPELFRGSFDQLPLGDYVQLSATAWAKALPILDSRLRGHDITLSPRGGIGVYVHGGEVSVRNFRVESLVSR